MGLHDVDINMENHIDNYDERESSNEKSERLEIEADQLYDQAKDLQGEVLCE